MINQKTYSFLIKFLILAFTFLSLSIIVQSFISDDSEIEQNSSIPFLKIEDRIADSVITTLTLDDKLELIVRTKLPDLIKSESIEQETDFETMRHQF